MINAVSQSVLSPFFLSGSTGKLFSLYTSPAQKIPPEHFVVFFPPFAEENNKSRYMVSLQAKKFAAMGYGVLMVDFYGTGDSEGDFGEASWDIWLQDVEHIRQWLDQQGAKHIILWGLRFGALFAMHVAPLFGDGLDRILLWQPVIRGELMMSQFLRLRMAADMIGSGEKVTVRDLRDQLANGANIEVAGYELSPDLVEGIDGLKLQHLGATESPPVEWVEVVSSEEQPIGPASQKCVDAWCELGMQVNTHTVVGEPFWVTPEITILPTLLERTSEILQEAGCGR